MKSWQSWAKRAIDVVFSLIALIVFSPVFLVIMLAMKISSRGPVFFRQQRPGLGGKPFMLAKFRSMVDAYDAEGKLLPPEKRITRLGRLLRASSLDELPEFWNVLKGDMSLVGPRPLLMRYLDRYTPEQARRHEVRPGLTGWAQVHGRNAVDWEERLALDVYYVDHWSLALDFRIMARTLMMVIKHVGIDQPGRVTMSEFMGTQKKT
jgi:sugar transferase EpsL